MPHRLVREHLLAALLESPEEGILSVSLDGTIEMSAEDAQYYIRDGWAKLAGWTTDEAA